LKSRLAKEAAIPPLPPHLLPLPECKGKGGGRVPLPDSDGRSGGRKRLTRKEKIASDRMQQGNGGAQSTGDPAGPLPPLQPSSSASSAGAGLAQTVAELLSNYQPASSERRPFYCRICRFQGQSLEDLAHHKKGELHRLAQESERKLSFCRLCRKQFTSMEQMKSHLKGKPHQELLMKRRGGGGRREGRRQVEQRC